MPKLEGPLLSLNAHGTLGGILTYSNRKIVKQVRFQRKQKDFENENRQPVRNAFKYGVELWNSLTQQEKDYWTEVEKQGYADV